MPGAVLLPKSATALPLPTADRDLGDVEYAGAVNCRRADDADTAGVQPVAGICALHVDLRAWP